MRKNEGAFKVHHVCDVRWKGLSTASAYALGFYWEKSDGKTTGVSKLESPGTVVHAHAGQKFNGKTCKYMSDLCMLCF